MDAKWLAARPHLQPVLDRMQSVLEEDDGAEQIYAELTKAGLQNARDTEGRRPVGDAMRYLVNRFSRMRYA